MKVALLWLINEKSEILIAKRAVNMDSDAGVWGPSVSGKIEDDETALEAVIREAEEELSLDKKIIKPQFLHEEVYDHSDGKSRDFSIFYANVDSNIVDDFKLEPSEVAEVKWISLNHLQRLIEQKPETIIISSATDLWKSIFHYLKPLTLNSK